MSTSRSQSRRKKRRSGSAPMPMGGAGLMRFFEDSSIGIRTNKHYYFIHDLNNVSDFGTRGSIQLAFYTWRWVIRISNLIFNSIFCS